MLFVLLVAFVLVGVLSPLAMANGLLVERRYGLTQQSLRSWLLEQAKAMAVGAGLGLPVTVLFFYLWNALPAWWWAPFAAAMMGVGFGLSLLGPRLVLPVFHRVEPVQDPVLVERLAGLVQPLGLKVEAVLRVALSRTSRKASAGLVGMGPTRRILLSDTLLDAFTPEEIECVVAHEVGHLHHRHMWKIFAVGAAHTVLGLGLTASLHPWLSQAWGVGPEELAALPLLPFLFALWTVVTSPFMHAISRRFEWQADRFVLDGRGKAQAFASALRRLGAINLADPQPHPLVEFLFYTHPSLTRRIRMAEGFMATFRGQW